MCTTWGLIVESVGCYGMTNDDGDEVPDGGACWRIAKHGKFSSKGSPWGSPRCSSSLLNCNILIIDNEDQTTKVVFPIAKSLLEVTENNAIVELADKVDDLLKSAFDTVN